MPIAATNAPGIPGRVSGADGRMKTGHGGLQGMSLHRSVF